MSVEKSNDCVVIPHQINWVDEAKMIRHWRTEIGGALTGSEDRSTGAPNDPPLSIEFTTTTFEQEDRARLTARILEANRTGRCVVPFWGRGQPIVLEAKPYEAGTGSTFLVTGLEPGEVYWYEKGEFDSFLRNSNGDLLFESGYFCARLDHCIITVTSLVIPGSVTPVLAKNVGVGGLWPWAQDQWAFFVREFRACTPNVGGESRDLQIDCGQTSDPSDDGWVKDEGTGGALTTSGSAIDVTRINGWDAPPQAVLKTGRKIDGIGSPLASTYSGLLSGYSVTVTPGVKYAYVKGPNDANLHTTDSFGNGILLTSSGTFTAGLLFAVIACAEGDTPGTVSVYESIEFVAEGLIVGVEAAIRMCFADFSGGTPRRKMTLRLTGERELVRTAWDPWEAAAENSNAAVSADFVLAPAGNGTITISIEPEAPDFAACINSIQVFQRTWEVAELLEGTTDELLKMGQVLKGYYAAGTFVRPALFGRLTADEQPAITPLHSTVRLRLDGPLGDGELGAASCPAEVCHSDDILPLGPADLPELPGPEPSTGGNQIGPEFTYDGTTHNVGYGPISGDPPADLLPGVLDAWVADVWAWWEQYKLDNGLHPLTEHLIWKDNESPSLKRFNANFVYGTIPPNFSLAAWPWEIWVEYTT